MQVNARGFVFDVDVDGPEDGEPVLLLHGFPQNRTMWGAVATRLHAAGLRTIAMDQRGYSRGARPSRVAAYDIAECAADALAILDALDISSAHVVAHDWGAMAAWCAAYDQPARVRTLTSIAVPHPAAYADALKHGYGQRARSSYIALFRLPRIAEAVLSAGRGAGLRLLFAGARLPRDTVDRYVQPLLQPGALTGALNWYRALSGRSLARVGPVARPVTFLWGDKDPAVSRHAAERCAAHVTGPYELVELHGLTHWLPDQVPDTVADAALARIASLH